MNSGNEEIKYGKGEPTWIGNYRDKERDFQQWRQVKGQQ